MDCLVSIKMRGIGYCMRGLIHKNTHGRMMDVSVHIDCTGTSTCPRHS